jgi:hypothetical protein
MSEILTKSQLAEELEVTRGRISQLISRGMPVPSDGRIDLEDACRWIANNLDPTNGESRLTGLAPSAGMVAAFRPTPRSTRLTHQ